MAGREAPESGEREGGEWECVFLFHTFHRDFLSIRGFASCCLKLNDHYDSDYDYRLDRL